MSYAIASERALNHPYFKNTPLPGTREVDDGLNSTPSQRRTALSLSQTALTSSTWDLGWETHYKDSLA